MRKRPDYGNAKPEDVARALLRPMRWNKWRLRTRTQGQSVVDNKIAVHELLSQKSRN